MQKNSKKTLIHAVVSSRAGSEGSPRALFQETTQVETVETSSGCADNNQGQEDLIFVEPAFASAPNYEKITVEQSLTDRHEISAGRENQVQGYVAVRGKR